MFYRERVTNVAALLACIVVIGAAAICLGQTETPHLDGEGERFPVMMWKTASAPAYYDTYSDEGMARVDSIWRGHPGGNEACNVLSFGDFQHFCDGSPSAIDIDVWPEFVRDHFLRPLNAHNGSTGADMSIVLGQLYRLCISATDDEFLCVSQEGTNSGFRDHYLMDTGMEFLEDYIYTLCSFEADSAQGIIAGWMLTDEPELWGCDLAEYYALIDSVRAIEDRYGFRRHPMHISIHARSGSDTEYVNWTSPAYVNRFINYNGEIFSADGVTLPAGLPASTPVHGPGAVVQAGRFPSNPAGTYEGEWYYTLWEADVVHINYYTPLDPLQDSVNWGEWVAQARADFEVHGSYKYGGQSGPDDWDLHLVLPAHYWDEFPGHEAMHGYLRNALDLKPDGIGFWNWTPTAQPRWNQSAQRGYWLHPVHDWAEAIENEVEGADNLIIARGSTQPYNWNYLDRYDIDDFDTLTGGSMGPKLRLVSSVNHRMFRIAIGDFNGDGDDDLIWTATDWVYFDNEINYSDDPNMDDNGYGDGTDAYDPLQVGYHPNFHVTAAATGDFNGDGQDWLVLAATSDDPEFDENIIEFYRYSNGWKTGDNLHDPDNTMRLHYGGPEDGHATAMIAADFDGNGKSELLVAMSNASLTESWLCFVDEIVWDTQNPPSLTPYGPMETLLDSQGRPYITTAFAAGDFDADVDMSLLIARSSIDGDHHTLDRLEFGREWYDLLRTSDMGGPGSPNFERLYEGDASGLHVTAMNAGDYDGDFDDECLIGMSDSTLEENHLYFSGGPHAGNLFSRPVTTYSESHVVALAAGDFSPSKPEPRRGPKPKPKEAVSELPPPFPRPEALPEVFALGHGSPNPFNPITVIAYAVPHESDISIVVYDASGRHVRRLVDETKSPGWYSITWDGSDDEGASVASGVYFCKMETRDFSEVTKLTLLK